MIPTADRSQADGLIPLGPREFDEIRQLARRTFGLDLKPGKEELVAARLRRLVRSAGLQSYRQFYRYAMEDRSGEALAAMVDALTTNHTAFLREPDHFEYLCRNVVPELGRRDSLDIWSAACSTGEEVWSLAFVLNEAFPSRRLRIRGTDISRKALAAAQRAEYPADRCAALRPAWRSRYLLADGRPPRMYRVRPEIRAQAEFARLNLIERFPAGRQYPVIFCRNVMIYFDDAVQKQVTDSLTSCLEPGGYLFVGHAESLARFAHALEYVRPAVYRKPARREGAWNRSS